MVIARVYNPRTSRLAASIVLILAMTRIGSDQSLEDSVREFMADNRVPGLSLVVSRKGKVVFAEGYGFADIERGVPMKPTTVHELASLSKQFTAACILLLRQDRRLSLEDKLSKFFPNENPDWDKITVRDLLHHTSGLPDYLDFIPDMKKEYTEHQLVDLVGTKQLEFDPGTKFDYSNTGYMLLGFIVEKVSGTDLATFLRERVWAPSKMHYTFLNDTIAMVPNRTQGYCLARNKLVKPSPTSRSLSITGDGEVLSSALDLAKWDAVLYRNTLLNRSSKRVMFTPSVVSITNENGAMRGYGCGYRIVERDGKKIFKHAGGWDGTSTQMSRYVSDGLCVVILANCGDVELDDLSKAVAERFVAAEPSTGPGPDVHPSE